MLKLVSKRILGAASSLEALSPALQVSKRISRAASREVPLPALHFLPRFYHRRVTIGGVVDHYKLPRNVATRFVSAPAFGNITNHEIRGNEKIGRINGDSLIILWMKVSYTSLPNVSLFWHINEGIQEIMADYVHQEMTRNWILVCLRLFILIVIKDAFLALVDLGLFPNKRERFEFTEKDLALDDEE